MVQEIPVVFHSSGVPLAGMIYRNTDDLNDLQPAVVITGAWLTVKEQMPAHYARRLVLRGYTIFTFDFSGFGMSGGDPRQAEIAARKIADIDAAARFLRTLSFVKPEGIGYLGICASSQYAMAAIANGAPINAFVSVAGWVHDPESIAGFYGGKPGVERRVAAAKEALQHYLVDRRPDTVPAYRSGDENAGMFFELDYYANPSRGAVPEWKNEMAVMSWLYWFTFNGLRAAENVSVPSLFIHSDGCVFPDNIKKVVERLKGEKKLIWSEGTQTDFYDQPEQVESAIAAADQHFKRLL